MQARSGSELCVRSVGQTKDAGGDGGRLWGDEGVVGGVGGRPQGLTSNAITEFPGERNLVKGSS